VLRLSVVTACHDPAQGVQLRQHVVAQGVQPGNASARAVHFASQVRLLQLAGQLMHFAMAGVDGAKRGQMAVTVFARAVVPTAKPAMMNVQRRCTLARVFLLQAGYQLGNPVLVVNAGTQ